MKKTIMIALACVLTLGLSAANANAEEITLSFGDLYYVGSIIDGIPPGDEILFLNALIGLDAGVGDTTVGTEVYNREGSPLTGLLPPVGSLLVKYEDDNATGDNELLNPFTALVTGNFYVVAKYDAAQAGSLVWLLPVESGDTVQVPVSYSEHDLSHTSVYNAPDGGMTLILLGGALIGLGVLRRKFSA